MNSKLPRFRSIPLLIVLLLGACVTPREKAERLGSSHVAVLSVTDFADYKASLSPKYEVAATKALELAVPDTTQIENTILDAFRSRAGVQIAPTGVLKAGFAGPNDEQPDVTRSGQNIPSSELVGSAPSLDANEQAPAAINIAGLKSDPFLAYLAGTALFQEIKMLERYTMDAAVGHGQNAFIVRLQITNMPYSSEAAYDAYANIGFYLTEFTPSPTVAISSSQIAPTDVDTERKVAESILTEARAIAAALNTDQNNAIRIRRNIEESRNRLIAKSAATEHDKTNMDKAIEILNTADAELRKVTPSELPRVIPLLVTDQVESALNARRAERLRQLNFALAAAYTGLGAQIDLEKIDQAINRAAGRDYGSLFTAGRLADNAVRIRLGARKAVTSERGIGSQTMARTHNVTLLLLVPESAGFPKPCPVSVGVRWEYRDPASGKKISASSSGQTISEVEKNAKLLIDNGNYGINKNYMNSWETVVQLAQSNEYAEFKNKLLTERAPRTTPIGIGNLNRLWLDLISAKLGGNHDTTSFFVATKPAEGANLGGSHAYIVDDANKSVAVIPGVKGIDPLKVTGLWRDLKVGAIDNIALGSERAELRGNDQLVLEFPSLIKLKMAEPGTQIVPGIITVNMNGLSVGSSNVASVVLAGSKPTSKMALATNTKVITPSGADMLSANLTLRIGLAGPTAAAGEKTFDKGVIVPDRVTEEIKKSTLYLISFDGAEATLSGDTSTVHQIADKGIFAVVKSGAVKFKISNVPECGKFRIVTTAPDTGEAVGQIEITLRRKTE